MKAAVTMALNDAFKSIGWKLTGPWLRNSNVKGFKRSVAPLVYKAGGCLIQPGYCFAVKSITLAYQYIYPEGNLNRKGIADFSFPLEIGERGARHFYRSDELEEFMDFFLGPYWSAIEAIELRFNFASEQDFFDQLKLSDLADHRGVVRKSYISFCLAKLAVGEEQWADYFIENGPQHNIHSPNAMAPFHWLKRNADFLKLVMQKGKTGIKGVDVPASLTRNDLIPPGCR
ncbi:hypothetical protein [Simiduia litorea]|uniref:hypothetical protein n=1 Tax=Simiduia litorea TaxID=1435348 RepID=UPI0036F424C4